MTVDALAFEPHFLDHLSPLWQRLPAELRGEFRVDTSLEERARRYGLFPVVEDGMEIRRAGPRYPLPDPGPGPTALVASYGDIKVGRRLGYRRFVFLEHGAGQSYSGDRRNGRHGSYAGGEDREDVGLFLCPNVDSLDRWHAAYPFTSRALVGSPKIETLPARDGSPGPTVAIAFHWDCHLVPETRSALGHYLPVLDELAKRFRLIGHGHPRAADVLAKTYRRKGIEWVEDFADVTRRADVYVCDNSSTLFEFAALGRPVVTMNAPWYRREIRHGLRFWNAASVGVIVDEPAALGDAIAQALEERPEDVEAREAALDLVYPIRGTGSAELAADVVAGWLRRTDGEGDRTPAGRVEEGRPPARATLEGDADRR